MKIDFEVWLGLVDEKCYDVCGMSYDDLPDLLDAYAEWEADTTPLEFANMLYEACQPGKW